ncbi:MAG: hypothetical protein ACLURP_02755 [Ruminococcus sp.]
MSGTTVIILIAFVFYLAMMIVIGAVYMKKDLQLRGLFPWRTRTERMGGSPFCTGF